LRVALRRPERGTFEDRLRPFRIEVSALVRLSPNPATEPYWSAAVYRFDDPEPERTEAYGTCYTANSIAVAFDESVIHEAGRFVAGSYEVPLADEGASGRAIPMRTAYVACTRRLDRGGIEGARFEQRHQRLGAQAECQLPLNASGRLRPLGNDGAWLLERQRTDPNRPLAEAARCTVGDLEQPCGRLMCQSD
jgi:hypothetical protein